MFICEHKRKIGALIEVMIVNLFVSLIIGSKTPD